MEFKQSQFIKSVSYSHAISIVKLSGIQRLARSGERNGYVYNYHELRLIYWSRSSLCWSDNTPLFDDRILPSIHFLTQPTEIYTVPIYLHEYFRNFACVYFYNLDLQLQLFADSFKYPYFVTFYFYGTLGRLNEIIQ